MLFIAAMLSLATLSTLPGVIKGGGGELAYNIGYLIGQLMFIAVISALIVFLIIKGLQFIK